MGRVMFAIVVEGEVAATAAVEENNLEETNRQIAGFRSNPVVVETSNPDVSVGWTWDGSTFSPPVTL